MSTIFNERSRGTWHHICGKLASSCRKIRNPDGQFRDGVMKLVVHVAIYLSILTFCARPLYSQGADSHEALFQKLQSEQTAGEAFEGFLKLDKKRADVRE